MCVHFLYEIYLLLYEMPNHFFPNSVFKITFPIFRSSPAFRGGDARFTKSLLPLSLRISKSSEINCSEKRRISLVVEVVTNFLCIKDTYFAGLVTAITPAVLRFCA